MLQALYEQLDKALSRIQKEDGCDQRKGNKRVALANSFQATRQQKEKYKSRDECEEERKQKSVFFLITSFNGSRS